MNAVATSDGLAANESTNDQFLTFRLADQDYGVEILRVQEIKGWDRPTRIPHSPDYVLGVINLRGAVVPVIDLRARFGLGESVYGPTTVIIVVRVTSANGLVTAGLVVDAVCEVCNVTAENRRPAPTLGAGIDATLVDGLAMLGDRMLVLVGADRLVNSALAEPSVAGAVA